MHPQQCHTWHPVEVCGQYSGDRAALQRDLNTLGKWAKRKLLKFKENFCLGLFLNGQYRLEDKWRERGFSGKVLEGLVDGKLNLNQ